MRRRIVRYSIVGINVGLLLMVAFMVLSSKTSASVPNNGATVVAGNVASPLDLLSSADVAASVAQVTGLPEATAVNNQADTVKAELAVAPAEDVVAAKSQVVATSLKDRQDIQAYTAQSGDTIASLATKFDVTSNSIRWSNNLSSTNLTAGTKLFIPPINGIVYTVKAGDTPQSLASKYGTNVQDLIDFNDAEISGLTPGEQIVIPNGQIQQASLPSYSSGGLFTAAYGSNGYDFGFCTWYVASQISVPTNWGNAFTWAYYARLSGWNVSSTPTAGAIAQTSAGWAGHVAIVTAVSPDGSQIQYKDMNGLAGWDRVGFSGWVSASTFPNYITKP